MTPEEMLAEARAIAAKLKRADKAAYKDVFSVLGHWRGFAVPASEILECMEALEREFNSGRKPRDMRKYLQGARRSIRLEREAAAFRKCRGDPLLVSPLARGRKRGGADAQPPASVGEILDGLKIGGV